MAISQQFLQPYQGGQNRYMPQGTQGTPGLSSQFGNLQGYNNQMQAYQTPSYKPYQDQSWFSKFFFGTPETYQQLPRFTQRGQQTLEQLLSGGMNQLQNPYSGFEPLQQETMDQFYQQILPGIAERFTGQTGGALSSPSFSGQLATGGQGLAALLNAQKARFGQENRGQALQQLQLGLTDPFDTQRRERQPGFFESAYTGANSTAQSLAKLLPYYL